MARIGDKRRESRWLRFVRFLRLAQGDQAARIHHNRSEGARKGWRTRKARKAAQEQIGATVPTDEGVLRGGY